MRPIPQIGLDLIASWERDRLKPYLDSASIPTIGRGAIWYLDGRRVTMQSAPITQQQLEWLFRRDVARECAPIESLAPVPLTDHQYAALSCFCFNVGVTAFRSSRLRSALLRGGYDEVPDQMLRWCYAGGLRSRGLLRRRHSEAALFAAAEGTAVDVAALKAAA